MTNRATSEHADGTCRCSADVDLTEPSAAWVDRQVELLRARTAVVSAADFGLTCPACLVCPGGQTHQLRGGCAR